MSGFSQPFEMIVLVTLTLLLQDAEQHVDACLELRNNAFYMLLWGC